jgi:hypothetical protein
MYQVIDHVGHDANPARETELQRNARVPPAVTRLYLSDTTVGRDMSRLARLVMFSIARASEGSEARDAADENHRADNRDRHRRDNGD